MARSRQVCIETQRITNPKNTLQKNLPENIKCRVVQTGTKLAWNFDIRDKVDQCHLSNFIYRRNYKNKKCKNGDYIGKTARRKVIKTEENGRKDKQSWIYKHSSTTNHPRARDDEFEVLATNYPDRWRNNWLRKFLSQIWNLLSTNKKKFTSWLCSTDH